jgi:dTDP-glucose pyrophosphorylase
MGASRRNSGRPMEGGPEPGGPAALAEQRTLLVVGAGPLLSDVLDLLREYPAYRCAGILDPAAKLRGQCLGGLPVLGWLGETPVDADAAVIVNPAEPGGFDRGAVFHILARRGIQLPIFRAAGSRVAADVDLPHGTVLLRGSAIRGGAVLGENCLLGPGALVERCVRVPPHTSLLASSVLAARGPDREALVQPRSLEATLARAEESIREVVRRLNWASLEIVLVVDGEGVLLGTVTDGDVRRGLLAGIGLDRPVQEIMNRNPVTVPLDASRESILALMRKRSIRHLPVVDNRGRPLRLERMESLLDDLSRHDAVVMAGGRGTRLRPFTEHTPKPLLLVRGRPILDHVLRGLRDSGIEEVVVSLNYLGDQIRRHVGDGRALGVKASYVSERQRLGTAGALALLRPRPRRPFVVMNGDLLTRLNFAHLLRFQAANGYALVLCVKQHTTALAYGVVDIQDGAVTGIREKPRLEHFINAGIYVLTPGCLDLIPPGRYLDMPDLVAKILAQGGRVGAFPVYEYWRDIGTPADLEAVGCDEPAEAEEAAAVAAGSG